MKRVDLESDVEDDVCEWAENHGWLVRKMKFIGRRGCPDRIAPSGRHRATGRGRRRGGRLLRGHWRRPNSRWKDQALRWIEPYWRGPSLASIVEREYRLNP